MARWLLLGCVLSVVSLVSGCSGGGSTEKTVKISGTVNLDTKPLDDGDITLIGEGGTAPDVLPIKNGKFEGEAKLGNKRVEIRANRMGKPTKMGDIEIPGTPENYLPDRFNTESKMTAKVTESGIDPNKFDVQSK
jgi:hypothetical protein